MEMSEIKVCQNSNGILEIEIRPAKNGRSFAILWTLMGSAIILVGFYEFGIPKFVTLPLWAILLTSSAIVVLQGWNFLVWFSRGYEKLTVSSEYFSYERVGSFFDGKRKQVRTSDIVILGISSYKFGLKNGILPDRLQVKCTSCSFGIGRNISEADAQELRQLLQPYLAITTRATTH
jgi:hypothetical protein